MLELKDLENILNVKSAKNNASKEELERERLAIAREKLEIERLRLSSQSKKRKSFEGVAIWTSIALVALTIIIELIFVMNLK